MMRKIIHDDMVLFHGHLHQPSPATNVFVLNHFLVSFVGALRGAAILHMLGGIVKPIHSDNIARQTQTDSTDQFKPYSLSP